MRPSLRLPHRLFWICGVTPLPIAVSLRRPLGHPHLRRRAHHAYLHRPRGGHPSAATVTAAPPHAPIPAAWRGEGHRMLSRHPSARPASHSSGFCARPRMPCSPTSHAPHRITTQVTTRPADLDPGHLAGCGWLFVSAYALYSEGLLQRALQLAAEASAAADLCACCDRRCCEQPLPCSAAPCARATAMRGCAHAGMLRVGRPAGVAHELSAVRAHPSRPRTARQANVRVVLDLASYEVVRAYGQTLLVRHDCSCSCHEHARVTSVPCSLPFQLRSAVGHSSPELKEDPW
jgi:hypothetical protein